MHPEASPIIILVLLQETYEALAVVCLHQSSCGHILIVHVQGFVTQAAIAQIDLLTSIGNPSSIATCTQIFYSKLSYLLLP